MQGLTNFIVKNVFLLTRTHIMYIYIHYIDGDKMKLVISNSSDKPIYEHIATQIRVLIIYGELNEGDGLPSMRVLAKELRLVISIYQIHLYER